MSKPLAILELEKELNFKATLVDFIEIRKFKYEKTFQYALNKEEKTTGLVLAGIFMKNENFTKKINKLTSLTSLNLNNNQITKFQFLMELTNLTSLYLGDTQIFNFQFLNKLTNLTSLILNNVLITDIQFLKELTNLTSLNLSNNQITDFQLLNKLTNLTSLTLLNNQITDIQFLTELTSLTYLDLNGNQIKDIQFLKKLTNLTHLNLNGNQIKDIKILKELTNLSSINLNVNQITDIKYLKELINLTSLNLNSNQIADIQFLGSFTSLKYLGLNNNKLKSIDFLRELKNITHLNLQSNGIININSLKNLKTLNYLDLSHNEINKIESLKGLINITALNLNVNLITNISHLKSLTKINTLYLGGNEIDDIQGLKPLVNLKRLNLEANPITNKIKFNLDNFNVQAKQIKSWLTYSNERTEKIELPIKILLLGNSNIGKTSLRLFLNDKKYCNNHNSTHILEVEEFSNKNATIWDFGGQDYYHSVHHLFFTLRSLYIVMFDEETNDNKFLEKENHYNFKLDYWLENLNYITPDKIIDEQEINKKIMLVENKIDKNKEIISISDNYDIKNRYRINLCIDGKEPKKNSIYKMRIELLKEEIINEINILKKSNHVDFPITIHNIIKRIINKEFDKDTGKHYYTKKEFLELCKDENIQEDNLIALLSILRDSGLILYFDDFENDIWLYPDLLIKKIHRVLGKEDLKNKDETEIKQILGEKVKELKKEDNLLELLEKQEILFKDGKDYVFPQYLPVKSKDNALYNIAKINLKPVFTLKFKTFLPSAFMSRVICRFGKQKKVENEQRFYKRYEIIFTDKITDEDIRVWIKTDLEKLQVEIYLSELKDLKVRETYIKYLFKALIVAYEGKIEHYNYEIYQSALLKNEDHDEYFFPKSSSKSHFVKNENKVYFSKVIEKSRMHDIDPIFFDTIWFNNTEKYIPKNLNIKVNDFEVVYKDLINIEGKTISTIDGKQIYNSIFNPFTDSNLSTPKKIFISYSHKDYNYLERLEVHLASLRRDGLIEDWNDTKFSLGDHWNDKIKEKLREADIVILLVSADFINSNYVNDVELPIIKELEEKEKTKIFPIIVEDCDWESQKYYNHIQAGPIFVKNQNALKDDKKELETVRPIERWEYPSQAYTAIVKKIRRLVE